MGSTLDDMQGIEFEDEKDLGIVSAVGAQTPEGKPSFMVSLLEKTGVTDKSTANLILLVIAIVLFGITIFLYSGLSNTKDSPRRTTEEITAQLKAIREMQLVK